MSVRLIRKFSDPSSVSAAAALTCYSDELVCGDVSAKQKAGVLRDTFRSGHHTVQQHAHYVFALEGVSRQLVWSFLHQHPHYNSSQQSQRFVSMADAGIVQPAIGSKEATQVYLDTFAYQRDVYGRLVDLLLPVVTKAYQTRFPDKDLDDATQRNIKGKAQEIARYVLPIGLKTNLYHTVNAVTLYRYWRLCSTCDVPTEARQVVEDMLDAVGDSEMFANLGDNIPQHETPEFYINPTSPDSVGGAAATKFCERFDAALCGRTSMLYDRTVGSVSSMYLAVNAMLGARNVTITDTLNLIFNPVVNPQLTSTLQLAHHTKMLRALHMPHLVFMKKLSHTADSQDQRHRTVPGQRPILATHFNPNVADYITPDLIESVPEANDVYQSAMTRTWMGIQELLEGGVSVENALYLLPNAFPIRFVSSGDLLSLKHKWTLRLCLAAQKEIWTATCDEVNQAFAAMPEMSREEFGYAFGPMCCIRHKAGVKPRCTEGRRFCGVKVWEKKDPTDVRRIF